jgi:hypothetical protein
MIKRTNQLQMSFCWQISKFTIDHEYFGGETTLQMEMLQASALEHFCVV